MIFKFMPDIYFVDLLSVIRIFKNSLKTWVNESDDECSEKILLNYFLISCYGYAAIADEMGDLFQ